MVKQVNRKKLLIWIFLIQNNSLLFCEKEISNSGTTGRDYYAFLHDPATLQKQAANEQEYKATQRDYYQSLHAEQVDLEVESAPIKDIKIPDVPLSRKYYTSSLQEAMRKPWAVPISFHYMFANKGFNSEGDSVDLSCALFGKVPKIEDIYLLSKLANLNNIIKIDQMQFSPPLATPLPFDRPGGSTIGFGNFASDQYVALFAETELRIDAELREFFVNISAIYQFDSQEGEVIKQLGFSFPIKSRLHIMDLTFIGGSLFTHGKLNVDNFSETPFSQFAKDFTDLRDFFERAILAPKGLKFDERQRTSGIGDILLFGMLDWAPYFTKLKSFQTGINLVLPSGGKVDTDKIWAPGLGNGGAFQVDLFMHVLFDASSDFVNPNLRAVVEFSAPFSGNVRVPQLKKNTIVPIATGPFARDSELLKDGTEFQSYYINLFEEFDSTIAMFADQAISASTRRGVRFLIGGGNSIDNILMSNLSFVFQYNYSVKWKDKISIDKELGTFDTDLFTDLTESNAHTIGFKFHYNSDKNYIIDFGTQHLIWGKNTPQFHDVFLTLAFNF